MDTTHALAAIRALSADELRRRIDEIEAEAESLRTLLRAAAARERSLARAAEIEKKLKAVARD